jgi:uncharacterized protein
MTSKADLLARVETWARERLEGRGPSVPETAHGWLHVDRVRRAAVLLAHAEGVDPVLAACAALLHDVGRTAPGPESEHGARSAELAAPLLADLPMDEADRQAILFAVRWHNTTRDDTMLLCLLRDADMLDGLGAIGLLRAFTSKAALPAYDPEAPFVEGPYARPPLTLSDQVRFQMEWIDFLNTDTACEMAWDRIEFMRAFVAQLRRELGVEEEPSLSKLWQENQRALDWLDRWEKAPDSFPCGWWDEFEQFLREHPVVFGDADLDLESET